LPVPRSSRPPAPRPEAAPPTNPRRRPAGTTRSSERSLNLSRRNSLTSASTRSTFMILCFPEAAQIPGITPKGRRRLNGGSTRSSPSTRPGIEEPDRDLPRAGWSIFSQDGSRVYRLYALKNSLQSLHVTALFFQSMLCPSA
ncbi:hypothetical protein CI238_08897, partial [Colletotrichum incanum]